MHLIGYTWKYVCNAWTHERQSLLYLQNMKYKQTLINLSTPRFLYTGQAFRYSPENTFYIFNQQIYFIIWYLLDRASLI